MRAAGRVHVGNLPLDEAGRLEVSMPTGSGRQLLTLLDGVTVEAMQEVSSDYVDVGDFTQFELYVRREGPSEGGNLILNFWRSLDGTQDDHHGGGHVIDPSSSGSNRVGPANWLVPKIRAAMIWDTGGDLDVDPQKSEPVRVRYTLGLYTCFTSVSADAGIEGDSGLNRKSHHISNRPFRFRRPCRFASEHTTPLPVLRLSHIMIDIVQPVQYYMLCAASQGEYSECLCRTTTSRSHKLPSTAVSTEAQCRVGLGNDKWADKKWVGK